MSDKFLKNTYGLETPEETQGHYQKWAATYEDEVAEHGYATPGRVQRGALVLRCLRRKRLFWTMAVAQALSGLALRDRRVSGDRWNGPQPKHARGGQQPKASTENFWALGDHGSEPVKKGAIPPSPPSV